MLDSTTKKRFEEALVSDRLRELAMQFVAEGLSQVAVYHLFESFHTCLDEPTHEDESVLFAAMQCIVGDCSPSSRWFDHYLTHEEICVYRESTDA